MAVHVTGAIFLLCLLSTAATATDIQREFEALLKRVEDIEKREYQYVQTISTLQQQFRQQDSRVQKLELAALRKQRTIDDLRSRLQNLEDIADIREEQQAENASEFRASFVDSPAISPDDKIDKEVRSLGSARSRRLAISTEQVAFHAVADQVQTHLGKGQNVVFETVFLNIGDGYHNQHGIFIAPTAGVYVFSVSIMNEYGHRIQVNLLKNGVALGRGMAFDIENSYSQGSVTATVRLQEADEVWCEIHYPEVDVTAYGGRYTSFTGFLLY